MLNKHFVKVGDKWNLTNAKTNKSMMLDGN